MGSIFKKGTEEKLTPLENFYTYINEDQERVASILEKRISLLVDDESGLITINTEMPDPLAAAQLSHKTMEYLNKELVREFSKSFKFINIVFTS